MTRFFKSLLAPVCVAAALLACATPARAVTAAEYELKATLLFNFIIFTEWPAEAMPPEGQPLVIGVLGEDPFGAALDHVVQHESIRGHPIAVQRFHRGEDVAGCHVLFISRSEAAAVPAIVEELRGRPVLTVSDLDRFAPSGGMIGLVVDQNRIRMQVNLDSVTASHLALGAKLLRLAQVIRDLPQSLLYPGPGSPDATLLAFLPEPDSCVFGPLL